MPDPRLAAWMEDDKVSRTFAYDYPHGLYQPSNDTFAEMFTEHLGICSPVAERIGVGAPLQSARNNLRNPPTVDKWGFALSALRGISIVSANCGCSPSAIRRWASQRARAAS